MNTKDNAKSYIFQSEIPRLLLGADGDKINFLFPCFPDGNIISAPEHFKIYDILKDVSSVHIAVAQEKINSFKLVS